MHSIHSPENAPRRLAVAVVGDSLAHGLGAATPNGGLTQRIFAEIRAQRPASTYANYGVPHATMGDVLRHQIPKLRGTQCDVVMLIAGANDLRYTLDRMIFARRFAHLLGAVHEAAPGATVVVFGMPDVTQTIAVHKIFKRAVARLCRRFNDTMRRIAAQFGDGFVDLFLYTSAPLYPDREYLCDDGYHPNDFGYEEIAGRSMAVIWEVLLLLDTASTAFPDDDSAEKSALA